MIKTTSKAKVEALVKEKFFPFLSATSTATATATATGDDIKDTMLLSNTIASELATKNAFISAFKSLPGFSNDTTNYDTTTNTSVSTTSTYNKILLKNSPPNLNPFIPQKNGIYLGPLFKAILGDKTRLKTSDRPWVDQETNTIDISKIPYVNGNVSASYYDPKGSIFSMTEDNNYRYFKGNGIPTTLMGIFPVQQGTSAYPWYVVAPGGYDPKTGVPGSDYSSAAVIGVSPYIIDFQITKHPKYNAIPEPINYLILGVTLTGTVWHAEIANTSTDWYNPISILPPDESFGHPYSEQYHLHGYSWKSLVSKTEKNEKGSPLLGYALDGFGIYGPCDKDGNIITNDQLDECHGLTSEVMWQGKMTNIYHYVLNYEYPYSIGAFRGTVNYDLALGTTDLHSHASGVRILPSGVHILPSGVHIHPSRDHIHPSRDHKGECCTET